MPNLKALHRLAEECGLVQYAWAAGAGMHVSRLNAALRGHITLRGQELIALEKALQGYIANRHRRYAEIISKNFKGQECVTA